VGLGTGTETGRVTVPGAADLLDSGSGDAIVATPVDVTDPAAVASELATVLGGDATSYATELAQAKTSTTGTGIINGQLTPDVRTKLQASIDAGRLPGIGIDKVGLLVVAGTGGVDLVTARGTIASTVDLAGGATSVALVSGVDEGTQLYATSTDQATGDPEISIIAASGSQATDGPKETATMQLPAAATRLVFDEAAQLVEALGTTPDGTGTTVYVIDPHGKSVFADHRLPFVPSAWVLDNNPDYPTTSRGEILAFDASGETASIDIGHYAFAWRLPGVLFGALTAGLLFLLARLLFRRREVGVLVGLFVLLDGMFFVQSRIAMNDIYTGFFILAAYVLFAWLWLEPPRRRWAFWVAMPTIGVLLGLALASKWVGAYAIGALGILVLARSALGRLLLIASLIGLTGVLGWMGLAVPPGSGAEGNLTFVLMMIGLTLAAVVVTVYHPIAWSDEEVRLAVGGPALLGILIVLAAIALGQAGSTLTAGPFQVTPLAVGFALVLAGLAIYAAFGIAGRLGFGPLAPGTDPAGARGEIPLAAPSPDGWLRLGSGMGLPIIWMLGSLIAIPLVVYVISYLPWAFIENHQLWTGWPPGHTGQTLLDLTGEMYRYHNNLTAAHAASSPWWAWPLDLKPVWFYQGGFANSTAAAIYDAGNLVIWWLGIPALVFVAWQAFRRQSLPLALILIGFLCQWVSWARIDRAAFQYHYYTSLPFVVLALAYFVAEVWHGASRRTWMLARIAAATVLMGPVILWLLRMPLCVLANVQAVNKGSAACQGNPGNLVVTPSVAALVLVGVVTVILLVRMLADLGRLRADGRPLGGRDLVPLLATAVAGGALLALTRMLPSSDPLFSLPGIVPELIALVVAVPLGLVAIQVLTARDARRFVTGVVAAVAVWFVIQYPNIAALPMPSTLVNAYQGLLPTYLYPFQFSVNTIDRSGAISFADPRFPILVGFLVIASLVVGYSAWVWRQALAEDPANDAPDAPDAPDGAHGANGADGGPAGEPGAA
jgi:C-terminal four TMM region of protein-O-mannosyltransferase/Dolichyl-phosphate-mannose-protein mannosyltransferase